METQSFRVGEKLVPAYKLSFEFFQIEATEVKNADNTEFYFNSTKIKAFQITELAAFLYMKFDL